MYDLPIFLLRRWRTVESRFYTSIDRVQVAVAVGRSLHSLTPDDCQRVN